MKMSISLLIYLMVLGLPSDINAAIEKQKDIQSSRTLRERVDSYAELLAKETQNSKTTNDKYRAINRVLREIKTVREKNLAQNAWDEAHIELLVSVLESLPLERKFRKKDCSKYKNDLLNQYEPLAEEAPEEPAVKPGWTVLKSLCE